MRLSILLVFLFLFFSRDLCADFFYQATITGTVTSGTLNGFDISNSNFSFNADITNDTDQSSNDLVGTFFASSASFILDNGMSFVADSNSMGIIVTNDNNGGFFQTGFLTDLTGLSDAQGYTDFSDLIQFDPNFLREISLSESFDASAMNGPFSISNSLGDNLEILLVGNAEGATAQISLVPEPSASVFTLLWLSTFSLRRGR
ncbi:MAG: hypothetical protein AAGA30_05915 [Planctomycetota bacterium]